MPRRMQIDAERLSDFARWLLRRLEQRGFTVSSVAENANIDTSYIHKVIKSYLPQYQSYKRLSFEKTVQIGEYLGDVGGALNAAGYAETYQAATVGDLTLRPLSAGGGFHGTPTADTVIASSLPGSTEDEMPGSVDEWPPELLEAMHYSRTLTPETQRYIYSLWREQARVYAAVHGEVGPEKRATELLQKNKVTSRR